ncbi:uncharacterized protein LOC124420278 [Lucilia cuprina]|uniref:uncharacterized protein LOC124420278 n=1 Tax=Lucilia cuprina TaxID=7375 RepID=UPI001F06833A|nr:uncharacterized protein LOC124420278 [Lucilia cuprina]
MAGLFEPTLIFLGVTDGEIIIHETGLPVLDYTQYYMDLQLANTLGEPNWLPEYNLTHYYALSDISAISLHNFVDRFTSNDGSWFAKYYRANTVRHQNENCEGVCMLNHYCAITRVDYKEFRQCLEKEQSALRSGGNKSHTVNGKILIILSMMLTITMTYINSICDFLCIFQRLITRCQQLNVIKKFQLYVRFREMRIKIMGNFVASNNNNGANYKKETKGFDQVLLYNVESIESKRYQALRQQNHNCHHCLQQKPMSITVNSANMTEIKIKDVATQLIVVQPDQRECQQIVLSHTKKLYTVKRNTHKNNLRLEYLKLISLLILYSRQIVTLSVYILRVALNSIALRRYFQKNYSHLTFESCSKLVMSTRFCPRISVVTNNMLI